MLQHLLGAPEAISCGFPLQRSKFPLAPRQPCTLFVYCRKMRTQQPHWACTAYILSYTRVSVYYTDAYLTNLLLARAACVCAPPLRISYRWKYNYSQTSNFNPTQCPGFVPFLRTTEPKHGHHNMSMGMSIPLAGAKTQCPCAMHIKRGDRNADYIRPLSIKLHCVIKA